MLQDLIWRKHGDALLVYVLTKDKDVIDDVPKDWPSLRSGAIFDGNFFQLDAVS